MRLCPPVVALLICLCLPSLGHDFWIEPSSYRPAPGSPLGIFLKVGENFQGEALPNDPSHISRFVMAGPSGVRPVAGLPGRDPAGLTRVEVPGTHVVGYQSHGRSTTLSGEAFSSYLKEEGLDHILQMRAAARESSQPAREIYSRFAKSILAAEGGADPVADRRLGFPFELLVQRPVTGQVGSELQLTLYFQDKPLPSALVVAMNAAQPQLRQAVRTDSHGRVNFKIDRLGRWLIKSVHMVPAAAQSSADFESFWASLTFEARAESD